MKEDIMDKLKSMFIEHKKIFVLLLALSILVVTAGFTSNIPKKKLSKAIESNNTLKNMKITNENKNESYKVELSKQEKYKANLDNQNEINKEDDSVVIHGSKWKGIYTANQGDTELILEINEHNAVFNFGPTNNNPYVETGSYYMGKSVINTTTGFVDLKYTEWKEEAYGYEMLNLSGVVKGKYMTGILTDSTNSKIGNFKLTKVN